MESYSKLLQHPLWQRKRLEIFQRDNFTCKICSDEKNTLHVHHKKYEKGKKPWEYPDDNFLTVCEHCHEDLSVFKKQTNKKNFYKVPTYIPTPLFNLLQTQKHFSDLPALYLFYCHTAKWQKTNQPKATTNYVAKGLGWGEDKTRSKKKILIQLGLIKDIQRRNNQHITGHFIKVIFIVTKKDIPKTLKRKRKIRTT